MLGSGATSVPTPADLTYQGTNGAVVSAATHTYSNAPLGTATADRLVIVAIAGQRGSPTPRTLTGVTIGGVAATVITSTAAGSVHSLTMGIAYLVVAAGTTADVVATYSGAVTGSSISVYTATGLVSATPTDTATPAGANNLSFSTLDNSARGLVVASFGGIEGTIGDMTITGVTEDSDATIGTQLRAAAGSLENQAVLTDRTISVTSGAAVEACVAASWA